MIVPRVIVLCENMHAMAGTSVPHGHISSCYPSFCVSDRILNSLFSNHKIFSAIIPTFWEQNKIYV